MKALSGQEIKESLATLDEWSYSEDTLSKEFTFKNFKEALGFIVRVGLEAEAHAHHPNLFNVYNTVEIKLQTHDAGDKVTEKDIKLAQAIDEL